MVAMGLMKLISEYELWAVIGWLAVLALLLLTCLVVFVTLSEHLISF